MDTYLEEFLKQRKNYSSDIPFIASIQQYVARNFLIENMDVLLHDNQLIA